MLFWDRCWGNAAHTLGLVSAQNRARCHNFDSLKLSTVTITMLMQVKGSEWAYLDVSRARTHRCWRPENAADQAVTSAKSLRCRLHYKRERRTHAKAHLNVVISNSN